MYITTVCNFMKVEEFESKDKKRKFRHAQFLCDDIVIKCQFIKDEYYEMLVKGTYLAPVEVVFNIVENGSDTGNDKVYKIRLHKVNGWIK